MCYTYSCEIDLMFLYFRRAKPEESKMRTVYSRDSLAMASGGYTQINPVTGEVFEVRPATMEFRTAEEFDRAMGIKPKRGFFARLFGRKNNKRK